MISALPVATRGQQDEDDRGAGDQPGGVELVEDVGHAQQAVEADGREQEAEEHQDRCRRCPGPSERASTGYVAGGDEASMSAPAAPVPAPRRCSTRRRAGRRGSSAGRSRSRRGRPARGPDAACPARAAGAGRRRRAAASPIRPRCRRRARASLRPPRFRCARSYARRWRSRTASGSLASTRWTISTSRSSSTSTGTSSGASPVSTPHSATPWRERSPRGISTKPGCAAAARGRSARSASCRERSRPPSAPAPGRARRARPSRGVAGRGPGSRGRSATASTRPSSSPATASPGFALVITSR